MSESPTPLKTERIAMLIDGDNAQPSLIGEIIAEAGKYGLVTIRRIYGDWTTTNMNGWKDILHVHAVQPIQQFRYTIGKNATDSALIIDAMDILYEGGVSGFCLVSSDSDYTRLAMRIREKGLFVMGIGKKTTPIAFVNACGVFVQTENLRAEAEKLQPVQKPGKRATAKTVQPDPLPLLKKALEKSLQEDGWAFLGSIGNRLLQLDPSFDVRTYGFKLLSQLFRSYKDDFEIDEPERKDGPSVIRIRPKNKQIK
ncbi:MAG: hypothetical protein HW399_1010 [Dehalococcoidia bacterium]|nr:hypothetical protein [Dehalococcoidia bacterium]